MKNYLIIPSTGNTPYDNWFLWLKNQIEEMGYNVCVPYMPQGDFCCYKSWETLMNSYKKIGMINRHTTMICYDMSCAFVTKYIAKSKTSIEGIIAVSPFNTMLGIEQDNLNKTFIVKPEILSRVERFVKFYHCIGSNNDPFISDEEFAKFCNLTSAKVHNIEGGGHFDSESGYLKFPEIVSLIDNINKII